MTAVVIRARLNVRITTALLKEVVNTKELSTGTGKVLGIVVTYVAVMTVLFAVL